VVGKQVLESEPMDRLLTLCGIGIERRAVSRVSDACQAGREQILDEFVPERAKARRLCRKSNWRCSAAN
jgi:hypothetical protein